MKVMESGQLSITRRGLDMLDWERHDATEGAWNPCSFLEVEDAVSGREVDTAMPALMNGATVHTPTGSYRKG